PTFSMDHARRRAKTATSCAKSTSVRSSRSRTRHRQLSRVWHGVGYRAHGDTDGFAQNSIEFKPLLHKQLSLNFDRRRVRGLSDAIVNAISLVGWRIIRSSAPGSWRQAEGEVSQRS